MAECRPARRAALDLEAIAEYTIEQSGIDIPIVRVLHYRMDVRRQL